MTENPSPRASVDARDAEDDARAFRRRPRSNQDPRHGPFRLSDVGPRGVLLQDAVSVAVRPKRPRRRGSGDDRESPLPVRGVPGAPQQSPSGHADVRAPRRCRPAPTAAALLEDACGLAPWQGIGEMDRARKRNKAHKMARRVRDRHCLARQNPAGTANAPFRGPPLAPDAFRGAWTIVPSANARFEVGIIRQRIGSAPKDRATDIPSAPAAKRPRQTGGCLWP